jgi:hypothetical protein
MLLWLRTTQNDLAVVCHNTYNARVALRALHEPPNARDPDPISESLANDWHNGRRMRASW